MRAPGPEECCENDESTEWPPDENVEVPTRGRCNPPADGEYHQAHLPVVETPPRREQSAHDETGGSEKHDRGKPVGMAQAIRRRIIRYPRVHTPREDGYGDPCKEMNSERSRAQ
jgi:hypothetical protein